MRHYLDTARESDTYSLPDMETFYMSQQDFLRSGYDTWMNERLKEEIVDVGNTMQAAADLSGWYYWFCFPGCLPDSEASGPYKTEEEALVWARNLHSE